MTNLSRRGILSGMIGLVAAPAIVRATSLMPIKVVDVEYLHVLIMQGYSVTNDRMRELLMPGLVAWQAQMDRMPSQWDQFFLERA